MYLLCFISFTEQMHLPSPWRLLWCRPRNQLAYQVHLFHKSFVRKYLRKLSPIALAEWQAAVCDVLVALEQCHDEQLAREIRSAVRRLANSGEARFGSVSVGRLPHSSLAGERFCDDLKVLRQRTEELGARDRQRTRRST